MTLRALVLSFALLVGSLPLQAADGAGTREQILARARTEAAQLLGTTAEKLDVDKPLWVQGAEELDLIEIIMYLEEIFGVEIPDDAVGGNARGWHEKLNVRQLAHVVFEKKQQQVKK